MMRKLLQLSVAVLTFFAFTNAASACTIIGYQPDLPAQLKEL